MTNRQLLHLIGARIDRASGRKGRFRTSDARCRSFVGRHQRLLLDAFRKPNAEVFLDPFVDHLANPRACGFVRIVVAITPEGRAVERWTHANSDEFGFAVLAGLADGEVEYATKQDYLKRMNHALHGRASW